MKLLSVTSKYIDLLVDINLIYKMKIHIYWECKIKNDNLGISMKGILPTWQA